MGSFLIPSVIKNKNKHKRIHTGEQTKFHGATIKINTDLSLVLLPPMKMKIFMLDTVRDVMHRPLGRSCSLRLSLHLFSPLVFPPCFPSCFPPFSLFSLSHLRPFHISRFCVLFLAFDPSFTRLIKKAAAGRTKRISVRPFLFSAYMSPFYHLRRTW